MCPTRPQGKVWERGYLFETYHDHMTLCAASLIFQYNNPIWVYNCQVGEAATFAHFYLRSKSILMVECAEITSFRLHHRVQPLNCCIISQPISRISTIIIKHVISYYIIVAFTSHMLSQHISSSYHRRALALNAQNS